MSAPAPAVSNPPAPVNAAKLEAFMGQAVHDIGASLHAVLILIGDKLGLYKAMAGEGPVSPSHLALKTRTSERYVREWLNANAAAGYVEYDPQTRRYTLPPEQAMALAHEDSPVYLQGAFQVVAGLFKDEPKITHAFQSGRGLGWQEHHHDLFEGTMRFFRPNYVANLLQSWIPAMGDLEARLRHGAQVADVGCGYGFTTMHMAKAFPSSQFTGFDFHPPSVDAARKTAEKESLDNVTFKVAGAKNFAGDYYGLITSFDCLHDMGDPVGAARHVLQALSPEGTWMIVEPFAHDQVEKNHNPIGRIFYSASTMVCTPASLAQEVGLALGAQAGEARLREVVLSAGFTRFRRAVETPFNLVFEAKP
jgi:2-polyprenyl-3-methyl-5-hydroxy-6-metoxy-1,4-benzoquinol methylase